MIEYKGHYGDDLFICNVARQSTNRWKDVFDAEDERLIKFLAREQHISPFFQPKITFQVQTSFAIARQWDRHRIGTSRMDDFSDVNEMSRRYVATEPTFFRPKVWRSRPESRIKQGSGDPLPEEKQTILNGEYEEFLQEAALFYNYLLEMGVAPEQARLPLPVATETRWIETGSLHYWWRFCKLRQDTHAQAEIRELADQISDAAKQLFPVSWAAFKEYDT